jgi:hypothetical protein
MDGHNERRRRDRTFHIDRPAALSPVFKQASYGNQQFQPLPKPTGKAPYHLSLDKVVPADQLSRISASDALTFHVTGDTGGAGMGVFQQNIADAMEADFGGPEDAERPSFLYLLGDVAYFWGEGKDYYSQFYDPYFHYPGPIFAIPGNHDGDVLRVKGSDEATDSSLRTFSDNFCATSPHVTPEAGQGARDAMTQPNVYWTLETPFATMIGLYTNVPEGGQFDTTQTGWFVRELRNAPRDKALMVSLHHPPFSMDSNHGGSLLMLETLDKAFEESGRTVDVVFSGHIHNYQRFTRRLGKKEVVYIVAGTGGYWHLHKMQTNLDGTRLRIPYDVPRWNLRLEKYCDDRHGYVRVRVTRDSITGEFLVSSTTEPTQTPAVEKFDSFRLDLAKRTNQ